MFAQIFDPCLENISLIKFSSSSDKRNSKQSATKSSKNRQSIEQLSQLVTLGDVVSASNFVLFYVLRSTTQPNAQFLQNLRHFLSVKNHKEEASLSSPVKIKRFFGLKKDKNRKNTLAEVAGIKQDNISVIVLDVEPLSVEANLTFVSEEEFYFFPPQQYTAKSRLLRALKFTHAPSLIVLDSSDFSIQTSHGYSILLEDKDGNSFPWSDTSPNEIFNGNILRHRPGDNSSEFEDVEFSSLKPSVKGLFFGAKWCPPSRVISKQIAGIYGKIKEAHPCFEVFFCSSDRTEESFREYFATMPWLAFPYGSERLAQLSRTFDVCGIPTFLLLDDENQLITRSGRSVLLADPHGKEFPWKRQPLLELTEHTVHRISEMPSLMLFTEGSPEDTEFSIQILSSCAEWIYAQLQLATSRQLNTVSFGEKNPSQTPSASASTSELANADDLASVNSEKPVPPFADPLQVFYTGEDPVCDYILESLGQGQADLPLLLIVDMLTGHLAICDKPDVSETVVFDFVAEYRSGRTNVLPITSPSQQEERRVGGIPVNLIEQIISNQQQQQQGNESTDRQFPL